MTRARTEMLSWDARTPSKRWALFVFQLVIGATFLFRAASMVFGPTSAAEAFDRFGVPFPLVVGGLVTLVFVLGGVALIGGKISFRGVLPLVGALALSEVVVLDVGGAPAGMLVLGSIQVLALVVLIMLKRAGDSDERPSAWGAPLSRC